MFCFFFFFFCFTNVFILCGPNFSQMCQYFLGVCSSIFYSILIVSRVGYVMEFSILMQALQSYCVFSSTEIYQMKLKKTIKFLFFELFNSLGLGLTAHHLGKEGKKKQTCNELQKIKQKKTEQMKSTALKYEAQSFELKPRLL
uniref:Putative secreted protein n=1 Tax=Rhipicephalus microplus TaxID=6941 RepID=A0A6M2D8X9_RHIMP